MAVVVIGDSWVREYLEKDGRNRRYRPGGALAIAENLVAKGTPVEAIFTISNIVLFSGTKVVSPRNCHDLFIGLDNKDDVSEYSPEDLQEISKEIELFLKDNNGDGIVAVDAAKGITNLLPEMIRGIKIPYGENIPIEHPLYY